MICIGFATSGALSLQLLWHCCFSRNVHVFKLETHASLSLSSLFHFWLLADLFLSLSQLNFSSLLLNVDRWWIEASRLLKLTSYPHFECKLCLFTWQDSQCLLAELKNRANIEIRRHVQFTVHCFYLNHSPALMNNRVHLGRSECIRFQEKERESKILTLYKHRRH